MWYREAKQGSLWSRVSPTFEQDVNNAIAASIETKNFTEEDANKYPGYLKTGSFKVINIEKFENIFQALPDNPLSDYIFNYLNTVKSGGSCDVHQEIIVVDEKNIQNLPLVISILKHEITHAIEGLIPYIKDKEIYIHPGENNTNTFKNIAPNQEPLSLKEMRKKLEYQFYLQIGDEDGEITLVEARKKAKLMADKYMKELERRSNSFHGDIDLYMANPSELRAFRAELENYFSIDNLIKTFKDTYENLDNGKELYLKGFYDLIQTIVNVKNITDENYIDSSFLSNLQHSAVDNGFFVNRLIIQVINNLDPQYIRQIAKFLSDQFLEIKNYLQNYEIPIPVETEIIK